MCLFLIDNGFLVVNRFKNIFCSVANYQSHSKQLSDKQIKSYFIACAKPKVLLTIFSKPIKMNFNWTSFLAVVLGMFWFIATCSAGSVKLKISDTWLMPEESNPPMVCAKFCLCGCTKFCCGPCKPCQPLSQFRA